MKNPVSYALYIAFFPQLLAGPIVRASRFFSEMADWHRPDATAIERGLRQITLGLVKKLAIADQVAPAVDAYFANVGLHPGTAAAWTAAFAFGMQIYFDFSGYSDMAIGTARLLGFEFPANFCRPYLAWSITEFWRRWNISLSQWLRDYLYIPLGGNRFGSFNTFRNLMITMLLGGLWHGANWTFIIWGGYHGALLALERITGLRAEPSPTLVRRVVGTLVTFALVLVGWVFFRATSLPIAWQVLSQMVHFQPGSMPLTIWPLVLIAIALGIALVQEFRPRVSWSAVPLAIQIPVAVAALLVIELCSWPGEAQSFVYFKF